MTRARSPAFLLVAAVVAAVGTWLSACSSCGGDRHSAADGGADADTDTDTDADADSGSDAGTGADSGAATDCSELADFTPCAVVTVPDRAYDICISGVCRSPGCGSADCNAPGPHFRLPDSSQRLCYDGAAEVTCTSFPCAADGSPAFCGEDAQYGWDTSHGSSERFTRDTSVADYPVVADNATGLAWQGCVRGIWGDACDTGSLTAIDWAAALAYCDGLDWGGYADWRLPDEFELLSIVDASATGASIDAAAFPGDSDNEFWSTSTYVHIPATAWGVMFQLGVVARFVKGDNASVRCVRGEPTPRPTRFARDTAVAAEPVVIDDTTGREWQGCALGLTGDSCQEGSTAAHNWTVALAGCEALSWGGRDDWRLPDRQELWSIVETRAWDPAIDAAAFPGTPNASFWTSTTAVDDPTQAWFTVFEKGHTNESVKSEQLAVRCVRGGE